MYRPLKKIVSVMAAGAIAFSSLSMLSLTAAADDGFDDLDQQAFTAAMGVGWNLGNTLEATNGKGIVSETAWGNPKASEELLKLVKQSGFSSVRMPVSWLSNIGDGPNYTVNKTWLKRVHEVVDYCINNDLYVIVNMHGDGYYSIDGGWLLCGEDDSKQKEIKAKYESAWRQIAEEFKDVDEHLIFESMNEEFDGTYGNPTYTGYKNINEYNQIFVDTIRKTGGNNTKRWLLVPGWNTDIDQTVNRYNTEIDGEKVEYGFDVPTDEYCEAETSRIAVSVHYYNPWDFCGSDTNKLKTQWGPDAQKLRSPSYGTPADMHNLITKLYDNFTSKGHPVIIGEFGANDRSAYDRNNTEFRRYWCASLVTEAKKAGCIPVYWDNGWTGANGFALFNRKDNTVFQQSIIDGMVEAMNSEDENYTVPSVTFKELPLGDVNMDGQVTSADAMKIIAYAKKVLVFDEKNKVADAEVKILCDINEDAVIDTKDAMLAVGAAKKTITITKTNKSVYGNGTL